MAERRGELDMTPGPPDSLGDSRGLHRTLGLGEVTAGGVGIIIGAGIYVLIGAATVSLGFARYAGYFFDIGVRPAALALLAGLAVLATIGIKQSARVTVVLSAVQVGGLVIVIVIGAPHVGDVSLLTGPGVGGVLSGAA